MLEQPRHQFNQDFSEEKYQAYLRLLEADFPGALDFRVAETPVFVPSAFLQKMQATCDYIIAQVRGEDFLDKTAGAIPAGLHVPGNEGHPHFLIFDFGICQDKNGGFIPQLVEMQGFPTLFGYQLHQYKSAAAAYALPAGFSPFMEGFDDQKVKEVLGAMLKGETGKCNDNDAGDKKEQNDLVAPASSHTVLLELFPEKQKTRIDFLYTEKYFGIPAVCLTELKKVDNQLFYNRDGKDIRIDRIYNRLIFDELTVQPPEVAQQAELLMQPLDIEWVTHPNWFYRLSKYTLPLLSDPGIPETRFLSDFEIFPQGEALSEYVLKPLFSFAGNGVIIDVTKEDLEAIDPARYKDYILQKKVDYAPAIQTPDAAAKAEIRLFYIWPDGEKEPFAICNLARLTKGNMVGVAQNKNKTWVGGSFALFGQNL